MTLISSRDPDGSLALSSGVLSTPVKVSKKPSHTLAALTASVVVATTLALGLPSDAEARSKSSLDQATSNSVGSAGKNPNKKSKKPKQKKDRSSIIKMGSLGSVTPQPSINNYSNTNYSVAQIAPIGGIAANNMPTVPLGTLNPRVTAAEQEQRAATLAKIERIRTRPISYADLKKLVKTLDERDRLAAVFPISSTLVYPNSTEKLAIGEMLQVMLYDPDPKLHTNPKDALSNFKRLSMVTGQLDRAEQMKNTYFEKGSREYRDMTDILSQTRRTLQIVAITKGHPVSPVQELPFTNNLPGLKSESFSLQYVPPGADFRTPHYQGSRASLPKVRSTQVWDAAELVWSVLTIVPPAVKAIPPAPAIVIPMPVPAVAPIAKASVSRVDVLVNSTPKLTTNQEQLILPEVEKISPRTAKTKSIDAPQVVTLSQHAEVFSKLPPTPVLTDKQLVVLSNSHYVDRLHVALDFMTRPRLTKVDGKFVVTNAGDLSTEKAREIAVSDTDRALYIAGALEMLIAWKNPIDKAFLGHTSVLEAFQKILMEIEPPQGEVRAQIRSHIELSLMILYASGNPKNIAFAESALKTLKTELTDAYLQDLAVSLASVADRPMATASWVPGRLRAVVNYTRASTPQKN